MEIKDYIHYYLGCEVEYEGIINGKELKAEQQANKHDVFYIPQIKEVKGIKRGFLKRIDHLVDGTRRYRIGRRGLQTHYNTSRFKLVLRRLSSMTEEEAIQIANIEGFANAKGERSQICWTLTDDSYILIIQFFGQIEIWKDGRLFQLTKQFPITHYLLSRGFWLFGDEAFETGLIIEKK